MLELLESETNGDAALSGVSRTLSQAIDELAAVQRMALDVAREAENLDNSRTSWTTTSRRLC